MPFFLAAATPMASEMPLPIAPNSRIALVVLGFAPAHGRVEIGLVAGAADGMVVLGDHAIELVDGAPRIEQAGLDRELRAVRGLFPDPARQLRRANACLRRAALAQCVERRRGGQLGVGAHIAVRGPHAVVQPQRLGVDLDHLGLGKHVAAVDGVIVEARADGDHEVGLFAQFAGDVAREAADSAVMIWVKPGPQVTDATPTLPVARW